MARVSATARAATRKKGAAPNFAESASVAAAASAAGAGEPVELPLSAIVPSPDNPRDTLGDLADLSASIKRRGVQQPVLVRVRADGRHDLLYGHRRYEASILAGKTTIPVFLRAADAPVDELDDLTTRLVENLHRRDLTPMEQARAYQQMLDLGLKGGQKALAAEVGVSQTEVSMRLALLKLPEDLHAKIDRGEMGARDAYELARLADHPEHLQQAVERAASPYMTIASAVKEAKAKIDADAAQAKAIAAAEKAGVRVIRGESHNNQTGPCPLSWLGMTAPEAKAHEKLPCHALLARRHSGVGLEPVCTEPDNHRDGASKAQADADRDRQLAVRKAREDRTVERQAFVAGLVQRLQSINEHAAMMCRLLLLEEVYDRPVITAQLLGLELAENAEYEDVEDAISTYASKTQRNASRVLYAIACAAGELYASNSYRGPGPDAAEYLAHLAACGLELTDEERNVVETTEVSA